MKKNLLFATIISISANWLFVSKVSCQPWLEAPYLPQQAVQKKQQGQALNFIDIETAFNNYWQGKTITPGSGYKPFKRWIENNRLRLMPDGSLPLPSFLQSINQLQASYKTSGNTPNPFLANWSPLGPFRTPNPTSSTKNGFGVGRMNCIAIHPTDTNIMFAGSPGGGLWKTINGGQNWTPMGDNFTNMGVSDIAIDPTNPNTIYLATGDCDGSDTWSYGILKTTDGGNTWTNYASFFQNSFQKIYRLAINPVSTNEILMACSWGMYKSVDGGVNWGLSTAGHFCDVKFKPGNPSVVYAGFRGGDGFYKSVNGGSSYSKITSGLPTSGWDRTIIGITENNPSRVYLVFSNPSGGFYGMYKSGDSGDSFSLTANSPNLLNNQGWYDLAFVVSPNNENEMYVGGPDMWKSFDGGVNFTKCGGNYGTNTPYDKTIHGDHHMFKILNSGTFYVASDGGIYRTYDQTLNWVNLNEGLNNTQLYRIGDYEFDENLMIAGLQDNGAYVLNNGSWKISMISDGMESFIDPNNPNNLYFSWQNGGLLKSINGGETFIVITPQGQSDGSWITPFLMHPKNSSVLYCGYKDVFKSINAGSSWVKISNNLTSGVNLEYIEVDNTGNNIYAASVKNIWKTTDAGTNWVNINGTLPLTNSFISRVYCNPSNPLNVWVTIGGYTAGEKVYFSGNGGSTWTNISGTLPNISVNCIVLDLNSSGQTLYLGTDLGVYFKDNSSSSWQAFNTGLPNVGIRDLDIHYGSGKLRVATYGRGLWESNIPTSITPPSPLPCTEIINHPTVDHSSSTVFSINGFNNSTENAEFYSPDGSYTHISGAAFDFSSASTNNPSTSKIIVKIWRNDGPNGAPGTVLATKDLLISQIISDISNSFRTRVYFNSSVPATSPYYIGYEISMISGDAVGVKSTWYNAAPTNTGWYKSNNVWVENSAYGKLSMAAYAIVGSVPTPDFTVNSNTTCPGGSLSFTNNTTNANSYRWSFPGGTPDSSYSLNPTISYNTNGTYSVKLVAYGSCNGKDSITKVNYINIGAPILSANITNVSCNSGNNGSVDLSVSGTGAYSYLWSNGATTQDISNLAAGSYSVTVSISGCSSTSTYNISQPNLLTATGTQININCNGGNTGSIDLSLSGGTSPFTYSWSNGATTQDISGLTAASYSVTVTDSKGCSATHTKTITQPPVLNASATATNASCGSNNGAVNLTVSGGSSPYSFSWSNGATTEDLSNLGAGTFTVTVTDNKGCSKIASATVTSPGSPTVTVSSVTNVSCNGGSNGAIDITPSGGATPYSFNWSNGATSQDVSGLGAGSYSVTVTDAASCSYNTSINLTQPAAIAVSVASQNNVSCNGGNNGSVTLTVIGGTSPFTYSWSNGATTKDLANLAAGTYTVTVTASAGCNASASATITQPPALNTSVKTITAVSCNGGNDGAIDINVSGGVSPITYNWNNNAATQDIMGLSAGTYSVTLTDKNGCSSALSVSVSQPLVLTAALSKTNTSCYGASNGSINLNVNGGTSPYIYTWNTGANTQNISGLSANAYAVTVTDNKNCTAFQSVTINQPDSIVISVVSTSNVNCAGGNNGSVNISVSGGISPYTFSWSNGASSEDIGNLSAGNYSVTVSAPTGCSKIKSVSISQPAGISVAENSVSNVTCNGGNNGAISINVSGGTSPYNFQWSNGASSQNINGLSANPYSVTVTGTGGCSSVFSKTITQPPAIVSNTAVSNASCGTNNGAVDLSVSGGVSPYTYIWNTGASSQDVSSLSAGDYSVTITDANNCTKITNATVTQPSALNVSVTSVTHVSCNSGSNGAVNITTSGGLTPYTFNWSNSATTEDISSLSSGTFSVTVTDVSLCSYITSANVSQPAVLAASISGQNNVSCFSGSNGSIDLSVSGGSTPYSYSWSNGASVQDPTGLSAGTFNVTVTSTPGCTATASATISDPPPVTASSSVVNVTCNGGNNGAINLTAGGGSSPFTFIWSNNASTEDLSNLSAGNYLFTVTDASGCVKSSNAIVSQPPALAVSITNVGDANCNFNGGGSIDISVSGGTSPYAFIWSNGASSEDIQSVGTGNYSVTVTDTLGCTAITNANVSQPPAAILSINNKKDVSCNGGQNGNIDISVSSGIPPYSYNWNNNATTQDISGLSAGTYTVSVSSGGGCTKSLAIVISEPPVFSANSSSTDILCNGTATGTVNLSVSGGVTPYSYSWSNNSTIEDITGLAAGTYIVTVKDANNCTFIDTSVITQPSAITISDASTSATCGSNNGAVNITVSGGISSYSFAWSNGVSSEDISNVAAGNYTVTVTDANNCNKVHTAVVTQPGTLSASVVKTDITCNGSNNGLVNLSPSGGSTPYTFSWSNGASTEDIANLAAGNYTVTITDNSNCSYISSASIAEPAVLSSNTSVVNVSCYSGNNGAVNLVVSGGVSPFSYSWNNGATTQNLSAVSAGSYSVTITDANGCISQNSATVNQPPIFSASAISQINVSCNGGNNGSINLSVSGGATPFSYSWSNGASVEDPANLVAGTYSVTVTSSAGCNATANATITQPAAVAVSIKTQTNVACSGGNSGALDINVAGGSSPYSFQWNNGAVTQDITGLPAGNYSVTATDAKGCSGTLAAAVTQGGNISIASSVANVTCNGGSNGGVNITPTGGSTPYSYSWSNSATTEDISSVAAGNYSVTVTDAANCSNVLVASVSQPSAVSVSVASQTNVSCNGASTGSATIAVSGGSAPYSYLWSNGASTNSTPGLSAGTYTLTVTDDAGCTGTGNVTINEPPVLSASVLSSTDNSACGANDGSIDVVVTGGSTPFTFSWSNGAATEDVSSLAAGTYSATVTDANGCTDTAAAIISQPGTLSISSNVVTDVSCNGANDGAVDITVSGGTTPYTYNWTGGATSEDVSSLAAGTYALTVSDAASCNTVQSFAVDEPPVLSSQISITTAITCNGTSTGSLTVTVNGGTSPYTYIWSNGATSLSASGLSAGSYSVTSSDANSCASVASYVLVEPGAFSASVISKTDVSCNGTSTGSVTIALNGGTSPYTYAWSNAASSKDISGLSAGTYSLTVTDAAGCSASASAVVSEPAALSISSTVTDVTANGGSDGTINLTVSGGTSPYTFLWSNNASTEDLANLPAGTFSVTVTDALSCSDTALITVNQPAATPYCSGTVNLTAVTDTFDDGSASNAYGTNADCFWLIQPANTDYIILSFLDFRTELNGDFLTIYDGASTSDSVLASYSGSNLPYALQSSGGAMLVRFTSNNSVNDSGWTASYNAVALPTAFCQGTSNLTAASGTFSDGSNASNYNDYSDCKWLIQPSGATSVTLGFTAFSTEQDYDLVTVYDGADSAASILAQFSGANIPDSITSSGGSMLVHFTSDYSVNAPGWDAYYNSSNSPNAFCSGTTNLTAPSGSFGDGSGSANYGPNSDCYWLIQPTAASSITLSFSSFDTENGYDSVMVYDGSSSSDSLLGAFTGNSLPPSITSSGANMLVHFSSDFSVQTAGWFASYNSSSAPPSAYCSGTSSLTAAAASFSDGSTSNDYVENSNCSWLIQPPGATYITLSFSAFALENGYDFVYVYDGTDTNGTLLAAFTGNNIPNPLTVAGSSMFVWFSSDYIVNDAGWDADYTSGTGTPSYCSGTLTLTADSGSFDDGSGPNNNYFENADCYWLIQPPGATSITLDFPAFVTEAGYDSVVVYDGASTADNVLLTWWGNTLPPPVTSSGGSLLVQFLSDVSFNDSGWTALYTSVIPAPVFCSGTTSLTAATDTFSDGSAADNYLENANCKWLIQPAGASNVTLYFTAFDVENGYDFVYVYDGVDTLAPLLGSFTGNTLPANVSSSGGSMLVQFMSDYVVNAAGWEAYYDTSFTPAVVFCSGTTTLTAASGSFSDGSDSADYLPNADCSWLIQPSGASSVTLGFTAFATELDFDFVTLYDGATTSDPVLASFSGSSLPASVSSSGASMLVHFTSDGSVNAAGWDAFYFADSTLSCNITTSVTGTDASCNGCADGSATVTATGGSSPYTYLWSEGQSTQTATGLASATYYVTVYDAGSCSAVDSVFISEPLACSITTLISGTDASCSGCSDGLADLTVSGALGPISFFWSNSDSSEDITGLVAGTYYVTVSDSAGCSASDSVVIAEFSGFCSGTTSLTADSACFSDGSDTSDYMVNANCQWLIQPAGATSITLSFSAFATEAGYDSVTVYDGATTSDPILGSFNGSALPPVITSTGPSMLVLFVSDNTLNDAGWDACYTSSSSCNITTIASGTDASCLGCSDGSATVSANGGTSPYTYLWSDGQSTQTATGLVSAMYYVTVSDAGSCSAVDSVFISEPPACNLSVSLTQTNVSCSGGSDGSVFSNATGGTTPYSYLWSNAATTQDLSGVSAGTYALTVSDAGSCSDTASVTVSQPQAINASITGTDASCNGCTDGTADLTVTGGTSPYSFLWSNGTTTEDLSNLAAASYSVTISDAYGCSQTASVVISQPPAPFCSGTTNLTTPTGTFSDGSATNDYAPNSDCKWLIQPPGATSITLSFSAFDTEAGYDSVTVYDGTTTAAPVLGSFSGTALPAPVSSSGGVMLVYFRSDSTINTPGWDASYSITTEIMDPLNQIAIAIFPNPNNGIFSFSGFSSKEVELKAKIVNVLGEVVWTNKPILVSGPFSFNPDLSFFQPGVFFLNASIDGNFYVKKIIKE